MLALAALVWACAGDGAPTDSPSPTASAWAEVQAEILDRRCATGGCHAAESQAGGLSLAAGDSWSSLVNIAPQNSVARAAGLLRVVPNEPEASYFLRKLAGDLPSGEGSPMPIGTAGLLQIAPDEYEMIRQWILDGAPGPDVAKAAGGTTSNQE